VKATFGNLSLRRAQQLLALAKYAGIAGLIWSILALAVTACRVGFYSPCPGYGCKFSDIRQNGREAVRVPIAILGRVGHSVAGSGDPYRGNGSGPADGYSA
jgi:hypothetical protein